MILLCLFSYQDMKKLHGQLITEQEALYGSKPSPGKSGKKPLRTALPSSAMNRKLSLGGAMLQSSKPTLNTKKTTYYDQNAPSRRESTIPNPSGTVPYTFVVLHTRDQANDIYVYCVI